jgi:hypothetical protein
MVRADPYRLARDIRGIGQLSADTIAHKLGIARDFSLRARAGVSHALAEAAAEGHCRKKAALLPDTVLQASADHRRPGMGKTTPVNSILTILRAKEVRALVGAPSAPLPQGLGAAPAWTPYTRSGLHCSPQARESRCRGIHGCTWPDEPRTARRLEAQRRRPRQRRATVDGTPAAGQPA